jgi:hypothetical protein
MLQGRKEIMVIMPLEIYTCIILIDTIASFSFGFFVCWLAIKIDPLKLSSKSKGEKE